jgi:hypothetical protein
LVCKPRRLVPGAQPEESAEERRCRACSTARFADHDALMASASAARELRDAGAADIGLRIVDVNAFELAIAHLRVPELV